jgi:hypothetical protein
VLAAVAASLAAASRAGGCGRPSGQAWKPRCEERQSASSTTRLRPGRNAESSSRVRYLEQTRPYAAGALRRWATSRVPVTVIAAGAQAPTPTRSLSLASVCAAAIPSSSRQLWGELLALGRRCCSVMPSRSRCGHVDGHRRHSARWIPQTTMFAANIRRAVTETGLAYGHDRAPCNVDWWGGAAASAASFRSSDAGYHITGCISGGAGRDGGRRHHRCREVGPREVGAR